MPTDIESAQQAVQQGYFTPAEFEAKYGQPYTSESLGDLNVPTAPTPMSRDYDREQAFMQKVGINPMALGTLEPTSLFEGTYTPEELAGLQEYQNLKQLQASTQQAGANMMATERPTTSAMRVLEDALRTKTDVGTQGLGESELFKQAGISGYTTLMQSMNQRGQEMQNKHSSFVNQLDKVSTSMQDAWQLSLDQYDFLKGQLDEEEAKYQNMIDQVVALEQQFQLMDRQHNLDMEFEGYKAGLKEKADAAKAKASADAGVFSAEAPVSVGGEFQNKVTGSGTPTAYGSSAWPHGLDIAGPKESAIMSPGAGEVIAITSGYASVGPNDEAGKDQNSGFGNQVKIRLDDGNEIWISHLDAADTEKLFVGAAVKPGQTIGTMGNTGYTMGKSGVHADITMKDADGNYISPEAVANYIQGPTGSTAVSAKDIPLIGEYLPNIGMMLPDTNVDFIVNDYESLASLIGVIDDLKLTDEEAKAYIKKGIKEAHGVDLSTIQMNKILDRMQSLRERQED